jgi:membrane-bound lytic murein transglycosylase B
MTQTALATRLLGLVALLTLCLANPAQADTAFRAWVEALWPEAKAFGISRPTFDVAFKGVEPDLTLPDLALPGRTPTGGGQAEFTRPPQDYLNRRQLEGLGAQGRELAKRYATALDTIETKLGVERAIVLAIWGRETAFGSYKLPHYAIKVLATQAYVGRRKEQFRQELLFGLKLLEQGVVTPATMKSSWAGGDGADPVYAVGVLLVDGPHRWQRRWQAGPAQLRARCAGLSR